MPDPSYYPLFISLGMTIMIGGFIPFTGHWIVCGIGLAIFTWSFWDGVMSQLTIKKGRLCLQQLKNM